MRCMITRLLIQTFVWFGSMGLLLFLPAGTLNWPGAWVYLAEMLLLLVLLLTVRIRIEERVLPTGLRGYQEYTQQVRYRLIPYLW